MIQPITINMTIVSDSNLLKERILAVTIPTHITLNIETYGGGEIPDADVLIYDGSLATQEMPQWGEYLEAVFCASLQDITNQRLAEPPWTAIWFQPLSEDMLVFYLRQLFLSVETKIDLAMTKIFLNTLIDSVPDLVWFKDLRGTHLKVNDAFCQAVGKTKDQCQGRGHYYIWDLEPDEYAKGEFVCLETEDEVIRQNKTCLFDEIVKSKKGLRQFKTYKSPLVDQRGEMFGTVGMAKDVTNECELKNRLILSANTDFLTDLSNRRYFYEAINEKSNLKQISFVYFDLDNFKKINDTYGHQSGDDALILMAELLCAAFPDQLIARLGGDEFVVAFFGVSVPAQLLQQVQSFVDQAGAVFHSTKNMEKLTVSAGIACNGDIQDVDGLLFRADNALYAAKAQGKACCVLQEEE